MTGDHINSLFETIGGLLLFLNARKALRDRAIRGIHPAPTLFFWAWGVFNLWYYPSIRQQWSFWAGIVPCLANTVFLAVWFRFWWLEDSAATKPSRSKRLYARREYRAKRKWSRLIRQWRRYSASK